jgi:hypothetical protein
VNLNFYVTGFALSPALERLFDRLSQVIRRDLRRSYLDLVRDSPHARESSNRALGVFAFAQQIDISFKSFVNRSSFASLMT